MFWPKCSPNPTQEALQSPFGPVWGTPSSYGNPVRKTSPFTTKKESLWGGFWGICSALFFVWASGTLKKGCPGGHSKLEPFWGKFWDLPGGPQEGSHLHGSSIFNFAAGAEKGSKMGAKMERFGLPNPNYTPFGTPFGRNRCHFGGHKWRSTFGIPCRIPCRGGGRMCNSGAAVPSRTLPRTSRGQKKGRNPIHGKL